MPIEATSPRPKRRAHREALASALPLLLPALAIYAVFSLLPILSTFWLSFTDSRGLNTEASFVGLANYSRTAADPIVWQSLVHTFQWLLGHLLMAGGLGLVLALLISRLKLSRVFFRTAFFLPHLVSLAVVGVIWANIYDPFYGLLNTGLEHIGLGALTQGWLSDPLLVLFSVNVASSWQGFGLYMLLFIAGLQNIDHSLYEAAEIDGAHAMRRFWYISLPMLTPVILFNLVMGIIGSFQVFTDAYVMTKGGPNYASYFYVYYLYQNAFQFFRMGFASAQAWILFLIILVFTAITMRSSSLWVYYEGGRQGDRS